MIQEFRPFLKMLVATSAILLSLAPQFGLAQIERPAASTTASAPAATHSINVGADGLKFTPDSVTADIGDIILFRFYPQNHSVARADYKSPCIPYELTGPGRVGFWSGFQPISVVLSDPPTYQVVVNDTDPIFFYCSAPGACTENGMVGVINPNSTETLDTQIAYAENSTLALSPGQGFPVESLPTTSAMPSPTSTPTSSPTGKATPTATAAASSQPPLSAGAIVGIAMGGAAVLLFGSALIYFCGRQRTVKEIMQTPVARGPPSYQPGTGHMSFASSAGYPSKISQIGINPMGPRPYSNLEGMYNQRSGTETESYRSRSPPIEESRNSMIPQMNFSGSLGSVSPARIDSPLMRKSVPGSPTSLSSPRRPIRASQSNPISPMEETIYQRLAAESPPSMRTNRVASQTGPHELSVDNDRAYLPYRPRTDVGEEGYVQSPE